MRETCWNYIDGDDRASFCSGERRWHTKIRKLAEQNPDEVEIIRQPEDNGGVIYARLPPSYLKISPKKKMMLTEEERIARAERLQQARKITTDR